MSPDSDLNKRIVARQMQFILRPCCFFGDERYSIEKINGNLRRLFMADFELKPLTLVRASTQVPLFNKFIHKKQAAQSAACFLVEIRGFEPLTYTLRTYRATNCAISPY